MHLAKYDVVRKLEVGYFAQDQFDLLQPDRTAFQHWPRARRSDTKYGPSRPVWIEQAKADTRIGDLSGGEKRVLCCMITTGAPHKPAGRTEQPSRH